MVQAVPKEGIIEQYDKPMPRKHWQRTRKQTVNYAYDTPFATERQLEDQRLLQLQNRNPQALIPTKSDKLRSDILNARKGESRAVAVKAHVVNKIVREASGVYNYALVPPPRQKFDDEEEVQKIDPELHPKLKPYASEAKMKPIICSFGHRPKSASRTFHPATMKFRLRHSEIAKITSNTQTGFGLPVAVLAKVLHAPQIRPPSAAENFVDDTISEPTLGSYHNRNAIEYSDMFLSPEDEKILFEPIKKGSKSAGSVNNKKEVDSWTPSTARKKLTKSRSAMMIKLDPIEDRPAWDEAHYMVRMSNKEKYALKESRMLKGEILPIVDRLNRYNSVSAGLADFDSGFCDTKLQFDKRVMAGEMLTVPKSLPVPGRPLYSDPYDMQLKEVKSRFKVQEEEKAAVLQAKRYQDALHNIPKAEYFPTSELAKMNDRNVVVGGETQQYEPEQIQEDQQGDRIQRSSGAASALDVDWNFFENGYKSALKAARQGDTSALYDFNMRAAADFIAELPLQEKSPGRGSSAGGNSSRRFNFTGGRIQSGRKSSPNKVN